MTGASLTPSVLLALASVFALLALASVTVAVLQRSKPAQTSPS
jgi:hypothetical protein